MIFEEKKNRPRDGHKFHFFNFIHSLDRCKFLVERLCRVVFKTTTILLYTRSHLLRSLWARVLCGDRSQYAMLIDQILTFCQRRVKGITYALVMTFIPLSVRFVTKYITTRVRVE